MTRVAMATTARPPTAAPTFKPTFNKLFLCAAVVVEVGMVRPGVIDADVDAAENVSTDENE